jgi:hypothetical protein
MASPKIKLLSISNVFSRLMHFEKAGDTETSHRHTYDHGTLLSAGRVRVEMIDDNSNILSSKEFIAPTFIFVPKESIHRIVALEDNTVCSCIHAIRTNDQELVDPDFLVEQIEDSQGGNLMPTKVTERYNKDLFPVLDLRVRTSG